MSEFWSGAGCAGNPDFEFDHMSGRGVAMYRKIGPRRYIGHVPDGNGDVVAVMKRADAAGTQSAGHPPTGKQEGNPMSAYEIVAAIDATIEKVARDRYPDVSQARAVARYMDTPAGAQLYEMRDSLFRVGKAAALGAFRDAGDAALTGFAETIRRADPNLTEAQAYVRAMERHPRLAAIAAGNCY